MSIETIPDGLASDLRDYLLAEIPDGLESLATENPGTDGEIRRVRLKFETEELPVPRLVIRPGEPRRVPGMDGTARIVVSIELINSTDRVSPDDHRAQAGALDTWLRDLRGKRRMVPPPLSRCYLHDILIQHPVSSIRAADREQATILRAEYIVTLFDPDAD